jgi:LPXTG-motif cell wall-anchored protein
MWSFGHNLFYTAGMQDTVRIVAGLLAILLIVIVILRRRRKKSNTEDEF